MDGIEISVKLEPPLLRAAQGLAAEADITLGQLVRDLLSREVSRRKNARPSVRVDERLVAPLRARLAPVLAGATGWADLQDRLRAAGFILREAGGGLALHDWPGDRRLCKASDLGFSYSRLMERFGQPMPGHAHGWLADRLFAPTPIMPPEQEDDDFDLIERDWPPQAAL